MAFILSHARMLTGAWKMAWVMLLFLFKPRPM